MKIVIVEPIGVSQETVDSIVDKLNLAEHEIVMFDNKPSNDEELIKRVGDAEVMVVVNQPVLSSVIAACPNLKMISVAFTGYDHVDLDTCRNKNIVVCNSAGYSTDSVAELAVGFMIDLLRYVVEGDKRVRKGGTRAGIIGNELKGKTVGIIGTGAIGTRVAELTSAFKCNVLAFSRTEKEQLKEMGVSYTSLEQLLESSDIVTVHTPLTDKTKDLIGEEQLNLMKESALLIQTSRGGTVNEKALLNALNNGDIAGAGIDVFEVEPPLDPDYELLKAKNILVTPHVAFATKEALDIRAGIAFKNISTWLNGEPQNMVS